MHIITHDRFGGDRLMVQGWLRGQSSVFPLDFCWSSLQHSHSNVLVRCDFCRLDRWLMQLSVSCLSIIFIGHKRY